MCSGTRQRVGVEADPGERLKGHCLDDRKFNTETAKLGRLNLSFFSATCTSRSGSVNGNGRTITAFTTLKIVVFAAMASATVTTYGGREGRRAPHHADRVSDVIRQHGTPLLLNDSWTVKLCERACAAYQRSQREQRLVD
jgi:hypothetical protein